MHTAIRIKILTLQNNKDEFDKLTCDGFEPFFRQMLS